MDATTYTCGICAKEFPEEGVVKYCDGKHIFCCTCFEGWVKKSMDERNVIEKITDLDDFLIPSGGLPPKKVVEHYCHEEDDSLLLCDPQRGANRVDKNVYMIPELIYTGIKCPICREIVLIVPIKDGIPLNYTGPFTRENTSTSTSTPTPNPGNSGNIIMVGKVECHYLNGKKHGPFKKYYLNGGVKIECEFVNGCLDGSYIHWGEYMVRKICEISYVNGMMNGPKKCFDARGNLYCEESYQDGVLHGESKRYNYTGMVNHIETFYHGKRVYEMFFQNNGNPSYEIHYNETDGSKHGVSKSWYNNGVIRFIQHWNHGIACGIHQEFDSNGNLIRENDFDSIQNLMKEEDVGNGKEDAGTGEDAI